MLGIFDSGIGGLTVVRELLRVMPDLSFIYLGDTARTPYGNKSSEVICEYALQDTELLLSEGAKAIVVACNTASSVAIPALVKKYSNVPIFEVVSPAVAEALRVTKTGRIGVIGTRATINSGIYKQLLMNERRVRVFSAAAPLLVPLVEEGWLKKPETKRILKQYLLPLKRAQIDTLILGCTHFPLLKNLIAAIMGKRVRLVDPAEAVAKEVQKYILDNPIEKSGAISERYLVSDRTPRFQEIAKQWLSRDLVLEERRWE